MLPCGGHSQLAGAIHKLAGVTSNHEWRTMQNGGKTIATTVLALPWAETALATATPAQRCQASKNNAAGKYAACRESAEGKLALTGDATKFNESIAKCETKYSKTAPWPPLLRRKAAPMFVPCAVASDSRGDFRVA